VLLARVEGRMYAVSDVCTHLGCSLADGGTLEGEEVVCPCHSSRFSVVDGRVTAGPATMPLATYDLRVVDGEVEIREQVPSS
jgi:3-phenylpropionate/trans-cinnamate dioxygenase ferredoxin subunit